MSESKTFIIGCELVASYDQDGPMFSNSEEHTDGRVWVRLKDYRIAPKSENASQLSLIERQHAMLKRLEWAAHNGDQCPVCSHFDPARFPNTNIPYKGHRDGCELSSLIGEA